MTLPPIPLPHFARNLTKKLLFVILAVIFAALLASTLISFTSFQKLFERKVSELSYNELSRNADQFQNLMNDMLKLGNVVSEDTVIINALSQSSDGSFDQNFHLKTFDEYRNWDYWRMSQIERRLNYLKNSFFFNYEANIVIYSSDGISAGTFFDHRNKRDIIFEFGKVLSDQPWYDTIEHAPSGIILLPPGQYQNDADKRIFQPMIKVLNDESSHRITGLALINLDTSNLRTMAGESTSRNLYLYTADGEAVYSYEAIPMDSAVSTLDIADEDYAILQDGDNKFIVNRYELDRNGLVLYSAVDYSAVYSEMSGLRNSISIWILLIFLLVCGLLYLYISHLTQPLSALILRLKSYKVGPYHLSEDVSETGDIESLTHGFEQLIEEIETLTEKALANQRKTYELEYEMLKAQIQPHFIFNTLNVIKWTALIGHDETVANMIADLGLLLEASMNRGEEKITLAQEMELLRSYLRIQNVRFDNRYQLELNLPESLAHFRIIKLILQPLVENSINHGFHQVQNGTIQIQVMDAGTDILLTVTDNGSGIDPEKLQTLLTPDGIPKSHGFNGIGIRNIHERLKLEYGEHYGLTLRSDPAGTTVSFYIPKEVSV